MNYIHNYTKIYNHCDIENEGEKFLRMDGDLGLTPPPVVFSIGLIQLSLGVPAN